jgi:superfamily II DNA helicase RecQ
VVIDEGHLFVTWGLTFRPSYTAVEHILYKQPRAKLYILSATLTPRCIDKIIDLLRLPPHKVTILRRSNDRPLLQLIVRDTKFPVGSYLDLAFLLGPDRTHAQPPRSFCIFTNTKMEAMNAILALRAMLPKEHRKKLLWISAACSEEYRNWVIQAAKERKIWGFAATDIASMVCNFT